MPAHAVESLVDDDAISFPQVAHLCSNHLDCTGDLVPEDLRVEHERDGLSAVVGVVVGSAAEDMQVSAAQTRRGYAHEHVARSRLRPGYIANLQAAYVVENTCPHSVRITCHAALS